MLITVDHERGVAAGAGNGAPVGHGLINVLRQIGGSVACSDCHGPRPP